MRKVAATLVVAAFVFAVAGVSFAAEMTMVAKPKPAKLHIDAVRITKTKCGQPLEFQIYVKNLGGPFTKTAAVIIKAPDNQIGHTFSGIAAGATYHDTQASAALSADCCKEKCYVVSITANLDGTGDVPEWDHHAVTVCTKPGSVDWSVKPVFSPGGIR